MKDFRTEEVINYRQDDQGSIPGKTINVLPCHRRVESCPTSLIFMVTVGSFPGVTKMETR